MAERLTEHVWQDGDCTFWRTDLGVDWYEPSALLVSQLVLDMVDELAQALLVERERVGKLRAVLKRIEIMHHHKGAGEAKALAAEALREDGEGRDG